MKTFKGKAVIKGYTRGEALITKNPFSFFAGVNTETGDFIFAKGYPELENKNLSNKIFIYPFGKGSSGDSFRMYDCVTNNVGPAGIINIYGDPVHVQGAMMSNIPMVINVDESILSLVKNGNIVIIENDKIFVEK